MPDEVLLGLLCRSQRTPEKVLLLSGPLGRSSDIQLTVHREYQDRIVLLLRNVLNKACFFGNFNFFYFTIKKHRGVCGWVHVPAGVSGSRAHLEGAGLSPPTCVRPRDQTQPVRLGSVPEPAQPTSPFMNFKRSLILAKNVLLPLVRLCFNFALIEHCHSR